MGTALQSAAGVTGPTDTLSLTQPDLVRSLHSAYLESGADVLTTNTFRCSELRRRERAQVISAAVAVARRAAGDRACVAGSVGPAGERGSRGVSETVATLVDEGVELLLVETITGMKAVGDTAAPAIAVAVRSNLPAVVTVAVGSDGRTVDGSDALATFRAALECGARAVGPGCAPPSQLSPMLARLREALPAVDLVAAPSAGLTGDVAPSEFARITSQLARKFRLSYVSGCCGTTPAHIAALHGLLGSPA